MKLRNIILLSLFILLLSGLSFVNAQDYEADMAVSREGIWFSPSEFFAGDAVRIYARIENNGTQDITGRVAFYQGVHQIGQPQSVSIVAGGQAEEVWTDAWEPPQGQVNIKVAIVDAEPMDENWDNNEAISAMLDIKIDTDGDGIADEDDEDDDGDGMSDDWEIEYDLDPLDDSDSLIDLDDDGLTNLSEYEIDTDPNVADTDGDRVLDGQDDFPLDPDENKDTDGDGIGDNEDSDDDNDGVYDHNDLEPLDSSIGEAEEIEEVVEEVQEINNNVGNDNPFEETQDTNSVNEENDEALAGQNNGALEDSLVNENLMNEAEQEDLISQEENIEVIDKKIESSQQENALIKTLVLVFVGVLTLILLILFIRELIRK